LELTAEFPEKLACLFKPSRYKILYGGRGSAKSWGVARALLIKGAEKPLRVLCARELQNSIKDSVHKLLSDQIRIMGLEGLYDIQQSVIKGRNGTEFAFSGLKHNVSEIKSFEGADICWVEEAQVVSKSSWDTLIPTIRKDNSEIWATFNPDLDTDETYKRFVIKPPSDAQVIKLTWKDNPWFPEVLRKEKDDLQQKDPDSYLHVWEGNCRQVLEGAVYASELREAAAEGRITRVPYNEEHPVHTFWDLGFGDCTSIWFAQSIGMEFRIIDFFQDHLKKLDYYIQEMNNRKYKYAGIWLPHDAKSNHMVGRTVEEVMRAAYPNADVHVLDRSPIDEGIRAARMIFPRCWFDEGKCAEGIQYLRHYRYEVDPDSKLFSNKPLHDWNSHASDAFRYMAISIEEGPKEQEKPKRYSYRSTPSTSAWAS
jgi:phage terminase large subunit